MRPPSPYRSPDANARNWSVARPRRRPPASQSRPRPAPRRRRPGTRTRCAARPPSHRRRRRTSRSRSGTTAPRIGATVRGLPCSAAHSPPRAALRAREPLVGHPVGVRAQAAVDENATLRGASARLERSALLHCERRACWRARQDAPNGRRAGAQVKSAAPRRNQHSCCGPPRPSSPLPLGRVASSGLGFRRERTIRTRGPGGILHAGCSIGEGAGRLGMGGQTGNGRGAPVVGCNRDGRLRQWRSGVAEHSRRPLWRSSCGQRGRARAGAIAGDHASGRSRLVAAGVVRGCGGSGRPWCAGVRCTSQQRSIGGPGSAGWCRLWRAEVNRMPAGRWGGPAREGRAGTGPVRPCRVRWRPRMFDLR
jgi:hypothetical protein